MGLPNNKLGTNIDTQVRQLIASAYVKVHNEKGYFVQLPRNVDNLKCTDRHSTPEPAAHIQ